MCESRSSTTSRPGSVWLNTEIRLPCVPEATNRPASLPNRSAAMASSRLTVGSSSHTSSPTSARAIASRISGVGSVSVSERRSTTSCMAVSSGLALRREPLGGPASEIGVGELGGEAIEQLPGRVGLALIEVHFGQEPQRLGVHQRPRVVLDDQLEALARPARVALVVVVVGDPDFFLRDPAAADVDLGQAVRGVATLRIVLHDLLELVQRPLGQRLVLFDGLQLIVV